MPKGFVVIYMYCIHPHHSMFIPAATFAEIIDTNSTMSLTSFKIGKQEFVVLPRKRYDQLTQAEEDQRDAEVAKKGRAGFSLEPRRGTGFQPVLAILNSRNLGKTRFHFAPALEHGLEARATMKD